jgi:hypothetical protein
MALLVPNTGEVLALQNFLNNAAPQNQVLRLYTNNITPAEGDTAATYTEASGGGYSAKNLTGSSWTITSGAPSEASYARQDFVFTSVPPTATMYGYFVTQATSGTLMWAERFPSAPFTIINANDEVRVTPRITCD